MVPSDGLKPPASAQGRPWVAAFTVIFLVAAAITATFLLNNRGSNTRHIVPQESRRPPISAPIIYYHRPGPKRLPLPAVDRRRPIGPGRLLRPGAAASFSSLARSLSAQVGLAVAPLGSGPIQTLGRLQLGHAWSTIKVPILVTLMREEKLSAEEEQWATAALTASDNTAAADLFDQIERSHGGLSDASRAVQKVLEGAGDTTTTVATAPPPPGAVSTYGQTEWSLTASAEFYREVARGCLLSRADTGYVRGLMEGVIPEQRWGLGEAGFPADWEVEMKGGWGPENGTNRYLVRQSGVVQHGDTAVAVAMIAKPNSGSFEAGAQDLTEIAKWLRQHLGQRLPTVASCA